MKFNSVMNCYVFIELFEFFKRSVETLWNLHNSLEGFIYVVPFFLPRHSPTFPIFLTFSLTYHEIFLVCRYILTIFSSNLSIKVIGSR